MVFFSTLIVFLNANVPLPRDEIEMTACISDNQNESQNCCAALESISDSKITHSLQASLKFSEFDSNGIECRKARISEVMPSGTFQEFEIT